MFAHFLLNNPKKRLRLQLVSFCTQTIIGSCGFYSICNENHLVFPHCSMLTLPCQIIQHIITKWMLSTPITFSKPHSVIKWTNKVIWFAETEFPEISHGYYISYENSYQLLNFRLIVSCVCGCYKRAAFVFHVNYQCVFFSISTFR